MKNNKTDDKLSEYKINNMKQINKSYDSFPLIINTKVLSNNRKFSRNSIPQNIYFNINGRDFNYSNEKDIKSYVYINSERKKINVSDLRLKADKNYKNKIQYYLPVLMEKKMDKSKLKLSLNDLNFTSNKIGTLKKGSLSNTKDSENILNKNIILRLNTISNNNNQKYKLLKSKIINYKSANTSKENQKLEDYLEKIKNYRKKLKDQMINRYKINYSQHCNKKIKSDKDSKKEDNQFEFNYDNKSINNINKNVDNAINIFYGKIPNKKVNGIEKSYLNFSNEYIDKHILNYKTNNSLNIVNINLNEEK